MSIIWDWIDVNEATWDPHYWAIKQDIITESVAGSFELGIKRQIRYNSVL